MPCCLVKWTPLPALLVIVGRSFCLVPTGKVFLALGKFFWNRKDFFVVRLAILLTLDRLLAFLLLLLQAWLGNFIFSINSFAPFDRFIRGCIFVRYVEKFDGRSWRIHCNILYKSLILQPCFKSLGNRGLRDLWDRVSNLAKPLDVLSKSFIGLLPDLMEIILLSGAVVRSLKVGDQSIA